MAERTRTDEHYVQRCGTYTTKIGSNVTVSNRVVPQYETKWKCDDTVGQWDSDNPLALYWYQSRVAGLFGHQGKPTDYIYREVDNWPMDFSNVATDPRTYWPVPTSTQLQNWAWEVVGKTNPSRPHISVPTALGELKDLPHLIKSWGDQLPRELRRPSTKPVGEAAVGTLWYQFGVRPLIGDMLKLCRFIEEVEKLLRALRKLEREGFLTRRCVLESPNPITVQTHNGVYLNATCSHMEKGSRFLTHYRKVWGSCRWVLAGPLNLPASEAELSKFLRAIVGGFNVQEGLATTWELIPWSWLVDWFANIQNFLNALQNQLPLQHEGICVMIMSDAKSRYDHYTYSTIYPDSEIIGEWYERCWRKDRYPVTISGVPTASIPVFDPGRWSILGSLAVLKLPKWARRL